MTLLQAPPGVSQGKVIKASGSSAARPSYVWSVHLLFCPSPQQLAAWLSQLQNQRECILIRGCPVRGEHVIHERFETLSEAIAERRERWRDAAPELKALRALKAQHKELMASPELDEDRAGALKALSDGVDERFRRLEALGWYTRRKTTFREVPRRWVWLDLDEGLALPHEVKLSDPIEHRAALRWITHEGLPKSFEGVSFVGQWSSSAFLSGRKVKAHFAFLLEEALDAQALKAWARSWPLKWDPSTFRTVQPHFTAQPQFIGCHDPLPQRTYFVEGRRDHVQLGWLQSLKLEASARSEAQRALSQGAAQRVPPQGPSPKAPAKSPKSREPAQARPQATERAVEQLSRAERELKARATKVSTTPEAERALLTQLARVARAGRGERNRTLYLAACTLGRYEGGGQLSYDELRARLLEAAEGCGLLEKVGEVECARQVANGVRWGRERPLFASPQPRTLSLEDAEYSVTLGREINSALFSAQRSPHRIQVLALTCGGGKTTALCAQVARDATRGKTRVVLCRNHLMAQAFNDEVERYAAEHRLRLKGRVRLLAGLQKHCRVLSEAEPHALPALERALSFGRKALCGRGASRCEYAASCEGAKRPEILMRGLTIATHAMGPLLGYPEGAVVMIDELPTPVTVHKVHLRELLGLTARHPQLELPMMGSFSTWLEARPGLSAAAEALSSCLNRFAEAGRAEREAGEQGAAERYGHSLSGAQCLKLLAPFKERITRLNQEELSQLPSPSASAARRGRVAALPSIKTIEALRLLSAGLESGEWPSELSIHWRGGRAWLELRELYALPDAPLVALDGTAQRTERIWSQLARRDGRSAEVKVIAAVGESPLFARWVQTQQLRTSQLIHRSEAGGVVWKHRAVATLKRAAYSVIEAAQEAQLARDRSIGILAAKHVADALRLALSQACEPSFDPLEQVAATLINTLREALSGRRVVVGHVGAHDIGSNLYHGVDILVMLGSSKPDWGSTMSDLRALGVPEEDCAEVYTQIISARDVQALARARHLRRAGVGLMYVGDMSPPTGHDLPDVQWTQVEAAHPNASPAQLALEAQASELLFEEGYVCPPGLAARFNLSRAKANALCARLQRRYELLTWPIRPPSGRGRDSTAYGLATAAPQPHEAALIEEEGGAP